MIRLRSFGESVVEIDESRIGPGQEVLFATLLVLIMESGRPVPRGTLLELIWGNEDASSGRHCLRQALYKLKQWGVPLVADALAVGVPPPVIESDYAVVASARTPPAMLEAAALIRGPFLPGYHPSRLDRFADWVERTRDTAHAEARRVLVGALIELRARSDWSRAEDLARRCLEQDPLNEEATLVLAEAVALSGSKAHAIEILERYEEEVGGRSDELRIASSVLRRRISRIAEPRAVVSEPKFVGREADMQWLWERFAVAREGQGRVVQIVGEPGIGKTRLLTEFGRRLALERVAVIRTTCSPVDRHRPLSAFVDAIPQLLEAPGALGAACETVEYLRRLSAYLPEEKPAPHDPEYVEARVRLSFLDLLDAISTETSLVWFIDDLHWGDESTIRLLWDLDEWSAKHRTAVLATTRHDLSGRHDGSKTFRIITRRLHPLNRRASSDLLQSLASTTSALGSEAELDWCIAAGAGNALFLIQLATHCSWKDSSPKVPASITEVVSRRLWQLSNDGLRTLQTLALLDRHATLDSLQIALALPPATLLNSLVELEQSDLLRTDGSLLTLPHTLVLKAAIELLPPLARRLLHQRAAIALEAELGGIASPTKLWACADHWVQSGNIEKALAALRQCAAHSLRIGSPDDAIRLLDQALSMSRTDSDRIPLLADRAQAFHLAGDWRSVALVADEYWRARRVESRLCHNDTEILTVRAKAANGAPLQEAFAHFYQCVLADNATTAHRLEAAIYGLGYITNCYDAEAAHRLRTALYNHLDPILESPIQGHSFELIFQSSFGDLSKGADHARALRLLANQLENAAVRVRFGRHAAVALWRAGFADETNAVLAEAYAVATTADLATATAEVAMQFADVAIGSGDLEKARQWCAVVESKQALTKHRTQHHSFLAMSLQLALYRRDIAEAERLCRVLNGRVRQGEATRRDVVNYALSRFLQQVSGTATYDGTALRRLSAFFELAGQYSDSDLIVEVLIQELLGQGHLDEARDLLQRFVGNVRRDRSPLSFALAQYRENLHAVDAQDKRIGQSQF